MTDQMRSTLTFNSDLYYLLKERAALNNRSFNKEVLFLIEAALAFEIDGNLEIIRMLMKAQGTLPPVVKNPQASAVQQPEHTAMGAHSS